MYTVLHIFRQVLFWAENQGNYQNAAYKFGLIFMDQKEELRIHGLKNLPIFNFGTIKKMKI